MISALCLPNGSGKSQRSLEIVVVFMVPSPFSTSKSRNFLPPFGGFYGPKCALSDDIYRDKIFSLDQHTGLLQRRFCGGDWHVTSVQFGADVENKMLSTIFFFYIEIRPTVNKISNLSKMNSFEKKFPRLFTWQRHLSESHSNHTYTQWIWCPRAAVCMCLYGPCRRGAQGGG